MRSNLSRPRRGALAAALLLAGLVSLTACSSSETKQIPAGTTAGLASPNPPAPPQGAILNDALSKDTRQTLQDAMNSAD
jgi:hypothetical protein